MREYVNGTKVFMTEEREVEVGLVIADVLGMYNYTMDDYTEIVDMANYCLESTLVDDEELYETVNYYYSEM